MIIGILAHAFPPRDGNLHLDSSEEWTEGVDKGTNLRVVTAHEMGHIIGLLHSEIEAALMYPWYSGYVSEDDFKLHDDDIQGARAQYGPSSGLRLVQSENTNLKRKHLNKWLIVKDRKKDIV